MDSSPIPTNSSSVTLFIATPEIYAFPKAGAYSIAAVGRRWWTGRDLNSQFERFGNWYQSVIKHL
jgi:hypothetical protein